SAFFSAPAERDDHGPRVTEDPPHSGQGDEAGEPIDILKSSEFAHPLIVTGSPARRKGVPPRENRGLRSTRGRVSPTRFREEPFFLHHLFRSRGVHTDECGVPWIVVTRRELMDEFTRWLGADCFFKIDHEKDKTRLTKSWNDFAKKMN